MIARVQPPLHCLLALSMAATVLIWQSSGVADAPSVDVPSDEAVMEQRRVQAKDKYQQGAAAYAASRYKDAVDLFLSADHLAPSAPLSFNIARAYEKLGDDSDARLPVLFLCEAPSGRQLARCPVGSEPDAG